MPVLNTIALGSKQSFEKSLKFERKGSLVPVGFA